MVEHVQAEVDHHLHPALSLLHPGGPHRSGLSLLCPQENPGVRASRRPGNHAGSGITPVRDIRGYQGYQWISGISGDIRGQTDKLFQIETVGS